MNARRRGSRLFRRVAVASLLGAALSVGCATSGTGPRTFEGTAGPIRWQVVDIGQVVASDDTGRRWSYTVLLRNTGTTSVRFERVDRGGRSVGTITGGLGSTPFERTLAPGAETRASFVEVWQYTRGTPSVPFGGSAALHTLTMDRRFVGKDEHGASVVVPVIMHFDRSVGKLATTRPRGTRPPSEELRAGEVARLAGSWQGHYRTRDEAFDVPLRIEVAPDGSFEAFENDPVTHRFRGRLQVYDGRVRWLLQGMDSGTRGFHQGDGRRLLTGAFNESRRYGGRSYTVTSELWLEASLPPAWASPVPPAGNTTTGLPPAVRIHFDTYKSDPKYLSFKAFAADPASGAWGRAWGLLSAAAAVDRALLECRKRSAGCEVYAVDDTVLEGVSGTGGRPSFSGARS